MKSKQQQETRRGGRGVAEVGSDQIKLRGNVLRQRRGGPTMAGRMLGGKEGRKERKIAEH